MVWIFIVSLYLLAPSVSAQTVKDAQRIVGKYSVKVSEKKEGGKTEQAIIEFLVEKDSLVMMVIDEYGNMQRQLTCYPVIPAESGPKGMDFKLYNENVDEEGDTIRHVRVLSFRDLDKKTLTGKIIMIDACSPGESRVTLEERSEAYSKTSSSTIYFSGRRTK